MEPKRKSRKNIILISLGCTLLIAATPCFAGARSDAWQAVECSTFNLEDMPGNVDCGYVTVPLRHDRPDGPTIELATVVIRNEHDARKPDPLFIAQGGPGGSSINTYVGFLANITEFNPAPNRDLVVWDQRGTLWSKPALLCPEVGAAELEASLEGAEERSPEEDLEPFRACYERLAKEVVDFSAFNSVENAHDAEALRIALGYEMFNFYGVSYGTELGQYLMREHPEHLRAVILDAVVPMDFNLVTDAAFVKQRIGEKYFESCAADLRCSEAFPDLGPRFLKLLDRLDSEPAIVEVRKKDNPFGEPYRIVLDGKSLEGLLYHALYINALQPFIPYIIDRADHDDFNLLSSMLLPMVLFDDTFAVGMWMTVVCAERGGTNLSEIVYPGVIERIAEEEREGAGEILAVCREWGIELLDPDTGKPVESTIPTLLLSGDFDPITPPAFAAQVGDTLANNYQVVFPKGTHGQAVTDMCANTIITSFLDDPDHEPDSACASTPPSAFTVPGDLIILPVLKEATRQRIQGPLQAALGSLGILLGFFVLSSAVLFYPIGWAVQRVRDTRSEVGQGGWGAAFSRFAPWLAVIASLVLAVFLMALGRALATDILHPALMYLGAVLSEFRWVFALPLLFALMTVLMVIAVVALWAGRRRSLVGRLYFSVLTLTALGVLYTLWKMQLLMAFF